MVANGWDHRRHPCVWSDAYGTFAAFQEKKVRSGQRAGFGATVNGMAQFQSLIVDFSGDGGADGT